MKKVIIQDNEGKFYGPISEKELEEGLKQNKPKQGWTIYYIDKMYSVEEIHESKLIPFYPKPESVPMNEEEYLAQMREKEMMEKERSMQGGRRY